MAELTGGLIQMNVHMVRVKGFEPMLGIGIFGVILFGAFLALAISDKSKVGILVCGMLTVMFAVLIVNVIILIIAVQWRPVEIHTTYEGDGNNVPE